MPRKFTGDTLVLATHNKGKVAELRDLLAGRVTHILSAGDLNLSEPIETGTTFIENATMKAVVAAKACKKIVMSDDSGLCIDALNGAPGVYSADWAGYPRNFKGAMHRVLQDMGDTPNRAAYFQSVIVMAWPDGHVEVTEGRIDGHVTHMMRGTGGFGYDPIFIPNGHAKTFAEMGLAEKKTMSHRSIAVTKMIATYF